MIRVKGYAIDADERQYIAGVVKTRKVKKDGVEVDEEYIANPRYYTKLSDAFAGLLEIEKRKLVSDSDWHPAVFLEHLTCLHEEFAALLKSALKEETK